MEIKQKIQEIIELYSQAEIKHKDIFYQYLKENDINFGFCNKIKYEDKYDVAVKIGTEFIRDNISLFDNLKPLWGNYWFGIYPRIVKDDYELSLKSVKARKLVLEYILKNL